jgi:hypothetical protein
MSMLFFFEIPGGVLKKLDYFRSQFFGKTMNKRKNID